MMKFHRDLVNFTDNCCAEQTEVVRSDYVTPCRRNRNVGFARQSGSVPELNGSRAVIVHFTHVRLDRQMRLSQMTKVSDSELSAAPVG